MLPDYTIRESARAKHVRFKLTVADGLVVVIPKGFDRRRIPELLKARQRWLMRAMSEIEKHRATMPSPDVHPLTIAFPSVRQVWRLAWLETDDEGVSIEETDAFRLQVSGSIQDRGLWQAVLKQWLVGQARQVLIPWTQALSKELGIPVQRVSIRCQKTRWGSYSSKGTVSLNAQLLFLPRPLVSYVLIHELCHAVHLNHSPQFWRLVRQWEPAAGRLRSELKTAGQFVPSWLHASIRVGDRETPRDE